MFKANKLLKTVSVVLIILGVINLIMTAFTRSIIKTAEGTPGIDVDALLAQVTPLATALSIILGILFIACGILAFMGKGYKIAVTFVVLILLYQVYSTISTAMISGFSFVSIFGYVIPLLYLWGLYQSKE